MITGAQMRAGRALLRWSADELSRRSKLGVATVRRAEAVDAEPPITMANAEAIMRALEAAGVIFVAENGDGPGVRLRKGRAIGMSKINTEFKPGTRVRFLDVLPAPDPKFSGQIGEVVEPSPSMRNPSHVWVRWPDNSEAGYPAGTLMSAVGGPA